MCADDIAQVEIYFERIISECEIFQTEKKERERDLADQREEREAAQNLNLYNFKFMSHKLKNKQRAKLWPALVRTCEMQIAPFAMSLLIVDSCRPLLSLSASTCGCEARITNLFM